MAKKRCSKLSSLPESVFLSALDKFLILVPSLNHRGCLTSDSLLSAHSDSSLVDKVEQFKNDFSENVFHLDFSCFG